MKVVAERVETRSQQNMQMIEGCDEFQGYLFSKPISVEAVLAYLPAPAITTKNATRQLDLPM